MPADISASVKVEGLAKLNRSMKQAGVEAQDQKDLMFKLGNIVASKANAPAKTGALANTVRAGKGKTKAVVRAGGARTPYAGVIHYGWPARGIAPNPFLLNALSQSSTELVEGIDDGIANILRKNGLK